MSTRRRILIIAGSDSSGGAGLEADQKVIASYGCYAMTATTALTAQNTTGVFDVHHTPPDFVKKQIDACIDDIGVDVVKVVDGIAYPCGKGMLASTETVAITADAFRRHKISLSVVDPVMVSTSGHQLLPPEAVKVLREELLPLTTILTPNIPEAKLLLADAGHEEISIKSIDDLVSTAHALRRLGPKYILLKGGHLPLTKTGQISADPAAATHKVVDVLANPNGTHQLFETDYIDSQNTHGTGCSLASAIASNLALSHSIPDSISRATSYIAAGIRTATSLGSGRGPINHFHSLIQRPFPPGSFMSWLLARPDVKSVWHAHTHHAFVDALATNTLPLHKFKRFLVQDYLYLIQFARANALAGYKAQTLDGAAAAARAVQHVVTETALHIKYCEEVFGLSRAEIESAPEHPACTAYSRWSLDVGLAQDWLALQVAFAPCLIGYAVIAERLVADPATVTEGNKYWAWVENYVAEDYVRAVAEGKEMLEREMLKVSAERLEELVRIFVKATELEIAFWDMGMEE